MLFAMIAKDKPGMGETRTATRPVHLDHLTAMGQTLVMAGALLDDEGKPEGSLMVIEAASLDEAKARFMVDPFVTEGIFGSIEIKPWRVAFNHTGREF